MDSVESDPAAVTYLPNSVQQSVKIVIVGPFAVGKTTFVSSVSEIEPLQTEAAMSQAGEHVDDPTWAPDKVTTTVALDFGRVTLDEQLVLYLFGTAGQHRFDGLWDGVTRGALGAVVLADTRRIDHSFDVLDRVEALGLPYVVAANEFDGAQRHPERALRDAFQLDPDTPLIKCDVRDARSAAAALIALVQHLLTRHSEQP